MGARWEQLQPFWVSVNCSPAKPKEGVGREKVRGEMRSTELFPIALGRSVLTPQSGCQILRNAR